MATPNGTHEISHELRGGIKSWRAQIATLEGRTVEVTMPSGERRRGVLRASTNGDCQQSITDADGRKWHVSPEEMARLLAEVA